MRIIAITNVPGIITHYFDGMVIDGKGTVRVGETEVHPMEVNHALAQMVTAVNDAVALIFHTKDPRKIEEEAGQIFYAPEYLSTRQQIFGEVVTAIRVSPDIQTTKR